MIESWALKKILRAFEDKDVSSIQSLVLQQCINPNVLIPSKGVSLLHLIIGHQSESFAYRIIKLFLRCGGNPNVQSSDGVTPTHVAAGWGRNRILHLLLVNGGDPWMQDDEKKNAFNYAFEEREWNTIEMLHHFQQMHSAANFKQDVDPKYERNLERVLLRKGHEVFSFAPDKRSTKSMTTQTNEQNERATSSPVQEKIRYFEPTGSGVGCGRDSENHIGWSKDFFQASCEVVVHRDTPEVPESKQETFVSSIHIDTSPNVSEAAEKSDTSQADVRGQLFAELQEAVRRRSKLKMIREERRPKDALLPPEDTAAVENDPNEDASASKEVPHSYGINLEESGMLKNMSDFASEVMNEIEVRECDRTIDLCPSSPDVTGAYVSCEEEANRRTSEGKTSVVPQSNSSLYETPYSGEIVRDEEKEEISNESFTSVAEEYKYTDPEEGVVLLEKKLVVTPTIRRLCPTTLGSPTRFHKNITSFLAPKFRDTKKPIQLPGFPFLVFLPAMSTALSLCFHEDAEGGESSESENSSSATSTASTVPSSLSYNSDVLRYELNGLGYHPGPITKTTKKLYLRKLWRLKKATRTPEKCSFVHSPVLERALSGAELFEQIPSFGNLEGDMARSFEGWTKQKWRGGTNKTSFNYLLLDPRISVNLPKRATAMTSYDTWRCFLSGIFYIGKGKRSRPYAHLYKAAAHWEKSSTSLDEKTERIVEIWKEGLGVVCLQVFQNVIPVEALTREAAMIDAMGVSNLKNLRSGEYYGVASTWPKKDKIRLGTYLLYKAMLIFINEGERQIKPYDID